MDAALEHTSDLNDCSDLLPIPRWALSLNGMVVETSTTMWRLCRASEAGVKYSINWDLLDQVGTFPLLTARARHLLKLYLADQLTKRKASSVMRTYQRFTRFFRWLASHMKTFVWSSEIRLFNWSDMSEGLARAFLDWSIRHTAQQGNDFACLRSFYAWGVARLYSDFHYDILCLLKSIKAAGNAKGHHVRFRHPIKGPFSSDELFSIRKAIQAEQGTDRDRAVVMLHLELGLNPYATIQITNADLKRYDTEQIITYQLDVPRVKKRTVHRETKRRPISSKLGQLLERLQQGSSDDPLLYWLAPSDPERALSKAMRRFVKAANILSPRTNALLKMTPRRFRTSLATHMAEQGASKFHIAEVLDHTDLQNVDVYTQTVSSIADHVASATDSTLDPLVKRFLGKISDTDESVKSSNTPSQVIPALVPHVPLPVLNTGGLGLCGRSIQKDGVCRLLPPLSCYLCPSFVAFRHGPHQEMLTSLRTFLQQGEGLADTRILKQLDDVCMAIVEVLSQLGSSFLNQSDTTKTERKDSEG